MLETKAIYKQAGKVTLRAPENYNERDSVHFKGCFEIPVGELSMSVFTRVEVNQLNIFQDGRLIRTHCMIRQKNRLRMLKAHFKRILFPCRRLPRGAWVINNFSLAYFHWFTEALPRINSVQEFAEDVPLVLPDIFGKRSYIRESLDIFGVKQVEYNLRETVKVDQMIAPSQLEPAYFDAAQLKDVRDRFRKYDNYNYSGFRVVYISRKHAYKRKVLNEDGLFRMLEKQGVEIVYMEELSFSAQRKLMSETRLLISNHGAGLTNMLFMPESSAVLELKANATNINNCYFKMARALDHQYYYTINPGNHSDIQKADVDVDLDELRKLLIELEEVFRGDRVL